jgi:nucleoside-diphosphate-sugar epimerase
MQKTNLNRILVIGETRFIGGNIVRYLAKKRKETIRSTAEQLILR